jgi:hypothetical protein
MQGEQLPLTGEQGRVFLLTSPLIGLANDSGTVRGIAKVANQRHHAALVVFRKTNHLIDLRPLLLTLCYVGCSPYLLALAHILREVKDRTFMNPQFLDDLVEEFFLDAQSLAEPFLGLRF